MDKVFAMFGLEIAHASSIPTSYYFKRIKGIWHFSTDESDCWFELSAEDASLFLNDPFTSKTPTLIKRRKQVSRLKTIKQLL